MTGDAKKYPVWLGLGANVGDRLDAMRTACNMISGLLKTKIMEFSSVYKTEPVGYKDQPFFYNCVIEVRTPLAPEILLSGLKRIEREIGRIPRGVGREREIDIDILLYGDLAIKNDLIEIPHPRMHERRFVLVPLAELQPNAWHPVMRMTVHELLAQIPFDQSVVRAFDSSSLEDYISYKYYG